MSEMDPFKIDEDENTTSADENENAHHSFVLPTELHENFSSKSNSNMDYYMSAMALYQHYAALQQQATASYNFMYQPPIGAFDIVELKFLSLHPMPNSRETCRIIGVAAGESLHNLYRIMMTALGQQEDRARLVLHCWIFNDMKVCGSGKIACCGSGPRYREPCKSMPDDKQVLLSDLPLRIGYSMDFVFGKCLYKVSVQDLLKGMTDENDLVWVPRIVDGSYGESPPFDLCYSPSLFMYIPPENLHEEELKTEITDLESSTATSSLVKPDIQMKTEPDETEFKTSKDDKEEQKSSNNLIVEELKKHPNLCAKYSKNRYLDIEELDNINKVLMSMKFIRHNAEMKSINRRIKAENIFPELSKRLRWLRFGISRFFYLLWSEQASISSFPDNLPSSLNTFSNPIYAVNSHAMEYGEHEGEYQFLSETDVSDEESEPGRRRKNWNESERAIRRKKDALAKLEQLSTSSLYHPYFGYPASVGPRVRVTKRSNLDPIQFQWADNSESGDSDLDLEDGSLDIERPPNTCSTEALSPLPEEPAIPKAKKKRGRPRKTPLPKSNQDGNTIKRKRGRPRKYPLPQSISTNKRIQQSVGQFDPVPYSLHPTKLVHPDLMGAENSYGFYYNNPGLYLQGVSNGAPFDFYNGYTLAVPKAYPI